MRVAPDSRRRPEVSAPGLLRTFVASTAVLVAALAGLLHTTEGGRAFTTETLRRSAVERQPQPLPDFALVDAAGQATTLHRLLAADERLWIVDFVYTRCETVCSVLGSVYQQLQQQIAAKGAQGRVGLLSISFDPQRDDAAALRDYAQRLRMDPALWQVVTLARPADRRRLLDAFGIMVLPAPLGEFEHNAAFHLVDAQGQLLRILPIEAPAQALDLALELTQATPP